MVPVVSLLVAWIIGYLLSALQSGFTLVTVGPSRALCVSCRYLRKIYREYEGFQQLWEVGPIPYVRFVSANV